MEEIVFHHTLPIQLRFNDVDKFGHVNNTVYFSFYDLGKTEYFASVCPGVDWEKTGIVVVHIEADFVIMVTFDLERHESMPLTEEWIEAICKYEGRDLRKKK